VAIGLDLFHLDRLPMESSSTLEDSINHNVVGSYCCMAPSARTNVPVSIGIPCDWAIVYGTDFTTTPSLSMRKFKSSIKIVAMWVVLHDEYEYNKHLSKGR
jgi:hypothetical protein